MSQTLLPLVEKGKRMDGLFYDPSSDYIYFFKSIGGKKIKFTTKIKRPAIKRAQEFANKKLKQIFSDNDENIQPIIADEIEKWLTVKKAQGLDKKTISKIEQAIRRIRPFWGDMFPREVDADNVARWFGYLDAAYPGQQRFNALKYFKNLCRYMNSKQFDGRALLPAIPLIKDPHHKKNISLSKKKTERIFTVKEYRKLLEVAMPDECLAAVIMYKMATRIDETLTMSFGEQVVRSGKGWEYVWSVGQNKADHEGRHAFPDSLNKELNLRLARLGNGRLFPQAKNKSQPLKPQQIDWADWRKRANLGWHWTSKTFRHTCLSNLFNDPSHPQVILCKQYRISPDVAARTYVKPTPKTLLMLKNASDKWS